MLIETIQQKPLTSVEIKALALCLRYLQRDVCEWGCDEVEMVPPFTQGEMVELKNAIYVQNDEEPTVTEEEEYLEELSLSSLYHYLFRRLGTDIPRIEG